MNIKVVLRFILYLILPIIIFLSFSHYEIQNRKIIVWCLILLSTVMEISLHFIDKKKQ